MSTISRFQFPLPAARISAIEPIGENSLRVTWQSGLRAGLTEIVDLSPLIYSFKFFKPLRSNPALFRTAHLSPNGAAVEWGSGDIDMSASSIERLAEEAMTADDFKDFLKTNGLTQAEAAAILGRSLRSIAGYVSGKPIPRIVALACHGFTYRRSQTS